MQRKLQALLSATDIHTLTTVVVLKIAACLSSTGEASARPLVELLRLRSQKAGRRAQRSELGGATARGRAAGAQPLPLGLSAARVHVIKSNSR